MNDASDPDLTSGVHEQELSLALSRQVRQPAHELTRSEPLAMLLRRGLHPSLMPLELPFDPHRADLDRVLEQLDRYVVRLFLRGAIANPEGFVAADTTRFAEAPLLHDVAESLEALGIVTSLGEGRYKLLRRANSFGSLLEWYVAHELKRCLGVDAVAGVKFHAPGVGGDLDVVACAEGKLVVLELKSSPPKHLDPEEVQAFVLRTRWLRPHIAIFAMDTALRLGDKVIPMMAQAALGPDGREPVPHRIAPGLWSITPHAYVVSARPSLIGNIGRALSEGLRALAPYTL